MNQIIEIKDNQFEQTVIKSSVNNIVLLKFWANWCQPCKKMIPIFENIMIHYNNKIKIFSINIENNTVITNKFYIRSIPTILIFYKKNLIQQHSGFLSENQIKSMIDKHLI